MGLLDELRKEADSRKTAADREKEREERLLQIYRTEISPKLAQAHRYFHELATHLNLVNLDVKAGYVFPGNAAPVTLRQGNYTARGDTDHATQETRETRMMFECTREEPINFVLENPAEIAKCEAFLHDHGLRFACRKIKNERFEVVGADFTVAGHVDIHAQLSADIRNACINLQIVNLEGFGTRHIKLRPEQLTEAFLDDLGNHLIRRKPDFMKLELSEEARQKIREQVMAAHARESEALRRAEEEEARAQEAPRKENLLGTLFKRS